MPQLLLGSFLYCYADRTLPTSSASRGREIGMPAPLYVFVHVFRELDGCGWCLRWLHGWSSVSLPLLAVGVSLGDICSIFIFHLRRLTSIDAGRCAKVALLHFSLLEGTARLTLFRPCGWVAHLGIDDTPYFCRATNRGCCTYKLAEK